MTARLLAEVEATGQTTDGTTVTTIVSADISSAFGGANNAGLHVELLLIGKDGGNLCCSGLASRPFKRISGTLMALGTLLMVIPFDGDIVGTPVATLDSTGTTIRGRVTGIASTTIDWQGFLSVKSGSF